MDANTPITSAAEFRAAFPQIVEEHTGGGCMAWRIPLPNGTYLLVTDEGGADMPAPTDTEVLVGWYTPDHEPVDGFCDLVPWPEAAELVRARTVNQVTDK